MRLTQPGLRGVAAPAAAAALHTLLPPSAANAIAELTDAAASAPMTFEPRGITPEDTIIFVLGCVPFVYAGIEFWTRIANGDSFGTGKDSVVIKPLGEQYEGNKRVLGQDAMIAARVLFGIAFASAALVAVAVFDVVSNTGGA